MTKSKNIGRGGRREGAGRPKGPPKVRLVTTVLIPTMRELERRAGSERSLGDVIDEVLNPKQKPATPVDAEMTGDAMKGRKALRSVGNQPETESRRNENKAPKPRRS